MTSKYKVGVRNERWRYFDTFEDAQSFCNEVFKKRNEVLTIIEVKRRNKG